MWTVEALGADLAAGRTTSRALVEQALARVADPAGEGARAFVRVYAEGALAEAAHADALRKRGIVRSAVDGLPVSVKDLFDVAGDATRAGSKLLAGAPPARADAPAVARLRAAGAILVGRSNMVEFAFGAVGLNPHYGTPRNPWDRKTGRVPGGSSSGAAVSVADGMCVMGLGTDTGGSVRLPAALCGVAGFKPTARRVPREGAFPLSYTLDSVGPLANTIACCAAYDAVLAGDPDARLAELPVRGLRLLVPRTAVFDGLEPQVARAIDAALAALARAGAALVEQPVPALARDAAYFRHGGLAGPESVHVHRAHLGRLAEFDPRVAMRVEAGKAMSAAEFVELVSLRQACIRELEALAAPCDALVMPAVPCVAPAIAEADASDEAYMRCNLRILRNARLVNFFDGCAATLPCHAAGEAPVGLMVCGAAMSDRHVLAVARAIEGALQKSRA
jgi:aspartyl-tRNA(Asn)/glutamyl-tRNA(Gln) amidotransferase subunit A